MGIHKLEEEAQAKAAAKGDKEAEQRVYYSIYAPSCSDPEVVRDHLDSGVLAEFLEKKEAKLLLAPKKDYEWNDPCYVYVLLGACAMTLGCQLPDSCMAMLKKVYTEGGLMPVALTQMRKALFGPDGFQNGVPYDFESKGLIETMSDPKPNNSSGIGMNVIGPGGLFNTGMGDSTTSVIIKELRDKHNNPEACGGCGTKHGQGGAALLQCARCKERKYCGAECQKKHWKVHKKVCEPLQKQEVAS